MALEATMTLLEQDLLGLNYDNKPYSSLLDIIPPFYNYENNVPSYDINLFDNQILEQYDNNWHNSNDNYHSVICNNNNNDIMLNNYGISELGLNSSPNTVKSDDDGLPREVATRPRRRSKGKKIRKDVESQRMTHIVVERNRRKLMNEYLNVLKSLMPHSYVQRGDQASIVEGAINFVKELEHNLQCLISANNKHIKDNNNNNQHKDINSNSTLLLPFQKLFTSPQYSSIGQGDGGDGRVAVDVEVTMVESHANLKIRLKRPTKLSKLVSSLLCLRLTILHLNVNNVDGLFFYSFSLKVEDDSKLRTVDEIAKAVYNLLCSVQEQQTN